MGGKIKKIKNSSEYLGAGSKIIGYVGFIEAFAIEIFKTDFTKYEIIKKAHITKPVGNFVNDQYNKILRGKSQKNRLKK